MRGWLAEAASREVAVGALGVSAVVGTVLNLINQGPSIAAGFVGFDVPRGVMNYVVPFLVSTWSAVRVRRRGGGDGGGGHRGSDPTKA